MEIYQIGGVMVCLTERALSPFLDLYVKSMAVKEHPIEINITYFNQSKHRFHLTMAPHLLKKLVRMTT